MSAVDAASVGGQTLTQLDNRFRAATWVPAWTDVSARPTWVDAGPYGAGTGLSLNGRTFSLASGTITPQMLSTASSAVAPVFYEGESVGTGGSGVANADTTASGGQRWLIAASQPSGRAFAVHNTELATAGISRWGLGPVTITARMKMAANTSTAAIGTFACSALRGGSWVAAGPVTTLVPTNFPANTWTYIQLNCDFRPDDANTFVGLDNFVTGITDVSIDWVSATPAPRRAPRSCKEILENGQSRGDGVYMITPYPSGDTVQVYCDMTTRGGGWTLIAASSGGNNMPRWDNTTAPTCLSASPGAPCFIGRDRLGGIPYSEFAWSNTAAAVHTHAPIMGWQGGDWISNAICVNSDEYFRLNQDSAAQGMGWSGCVPVEIYSDLAWCNTAARPAWNVQTCTGIPISPSTRSSPDYNCSPFGAYVAAGSCSAFHNIRHWRR